MVNLIETLQKQLGYVPLQKVNPNTQEVDKVAGVNLLAQAVIPAVAAGFYKITRSPQGAQMVLRGNFSTGWAEALFGENADVAVNNISTYAAIDHKKVLLEIERTGEEAVKIIQANITTEPRDQAVIAFMKEQRNIVLHYLPAALQIGLLLDDSTIDDKTNKMDGPISGLMHKIEKAFSGAPPEEPQVNR